MTDVLIGFFFSAVIAYAAAKKGSLDETGLIAGIILGTVVYVLVGWFMFLMMMVFFISSSLLSHFNPDKSASQRSYRQVIANGGVVFVLAIFYALHEDPRLYALMLGSIAMAMSDTWSSEIGRRSKHDPRHIVMRKPIQRGLSGGVTALGFGAGLAASALMALFSLIVLDHILWSLGIFIFGFLGTVIDSLMGTIQAKYKLEGEPKMLEVKTPSATRISGLFFLNNDLVNLLSNSLGTGLLAVFLVFV